METNFCRRCGTKLEHQKDNEYLCRNGHHIFAGFPLAFGMLLVNPAGEVLFAVRAQEPGKGKLDVPGGFIMPGESVEEGIARELREELHLEPAAYTDVQYLCSGVNDYQYDGETQHPLDLFFWARAKAELTVQPDDDVASATWHNLDALNHNDFAFKTVHPAIAKLKTLLA